MRWLIVVHTEPWESFMETYSNVHPRLVDRASTLKTLTFSQTTPTESIIGKHERTEDVEQPGVKKQKLVTFLKTISINNTATCMNLLAVLSSSYITW